MQALQVHDLGYANTYVPGITPGEGAAPILCATEPYLEALKSPGSYEDPLDEAGWVGLGPVHTAGKAGAKAVKCMTVEVIEPKGASLDMNAAPAPTESTASIELAGGAEEATTAKPKALEP